MKHIRLLSALLCLCLFFPSCSADRQPEPLKPDRPLESGGVGRWDASSAAETTGVAEGQSDPEDARTDGDGQEGPQNDPGPDKTAAPPSGSGTDTAPAPQTTKPADAQTASSVETAPVPAGSLSPFGAIAWWIENGTYRYAIPEQNTSGMATLEEMYSFPTVRFEDANKPPDKDNWFMGQATYDESTGEVTYGWDRWESTKATFRKYGAIYRGDETRKVCYLTFDCGYEYGATAQILNALRDKGAPGTFFLTGPYVRTQYDLVRRMLDEGHVVGNHTNNHLDMTSLSVDEAIEEMRQVERDYKSIFPDAPDMLFFRPPSGAVNEWLLRLEAKMGYRTVLWSYAYYDYDVYNQWDYYDALNTLKEHLHPGCVYLLHAESSTNAEILPEFIDWIRAQGYEIEPLCGIGA